ncbi:hypothetical protein N8K70_12040 [Microbacterium betulae]|uniref:ATP synthase protein I n=1 Tax=Microbacterium betulae TaxID=2981139 RepID=A0AA97I5H6_9MICO|nr:hypothetical protein [Microbacterium sp. AB]WOF22107.1 hypothetical protein N8K70_12040 [Microbacterium sp. AB]
MSPSPVTSTPVLRAALVWGAIAAAVVVVASGAIGLAVAGSPGLWSGVLGAAVGAVFPGLTAATILFANRWFGTPNYPAIFFGVFLGGWLVKFVVFIVVLFVLFGQAWAVPGVLYGALVAAVVVSFAVDVLVIWRIRVPAVSDPRVDGDAGDEA